MAGAPKNEYTLGNAKVAFHAGHQDTEPKWAGQKCIPDHDQYGA